jgi:hypothetical protein
LAQIDFENRATALVVGQHDQACRVDAKADGPHRVAIEDLERPGGAPALAIRIVDQDLDLRVVLLDADANAMAAVGDPALHVAARTLDWSAATRLDVHPKDQRIEATVLDELQQHMATIVGQPVDHLVLELRLLGSLKSGSANQVDDVRTVMLDREQPSFGNLDPAAAARILRADD